MGANTVQSLTGTVLTVAQARSKLDGSPSIRRENCTISNSVRTAEVDTMASDDTDRNKGDKLEAEAGAIVARFNDAKPSYSPDLEWFGMSLDHDTGDRCFVFEAADYLHADGLSALRECGRTVRYIEAYEYDSDVSAQIHVRVQGDVPDRSEDTGSGQS